VQQSGISLDLILGLSNLGINEYGYCIQYRIRYTIPGIVCVAMCRVCKEQLDVPAKYSK
jgi:hypothetical protein